MCGVLAAEPLSTLCTHVEYMNKPTVSRIAQAAWALCMLFSVFVLTNALKLVFEHENPLFGGFLYFIVLVAMLFIYIALNSDELWS